jgi:hypothetical protein
LGCPAARDQFLEKAALFLEECLHDSFLEFALRVIDVVEENRLELLLKRHCFAVQFFDQRGEKGCKNSLILYLDKKIEYDVKCIFPPPLFINQGCNALV